MTCGHEVKLIAPQYVRPLVKRQKNDATDAEALLRPPAGNAVRGTQNARSISEGSSLPSAERIVRPRTELVNALRAVFYEFGQIIPQGIHQIKRIEAINANEEIDVPQIVRVECRELPAASPAEGGQ